MQKAYKISFASELRLQTEFNLVQKLKERGINQPLYDVEHPRELFQHLFGRSSSKLGVPEFAKVIDVHRSTLSYFLNGRTDLSPELADKLAPFFEPKYGLQYSAESLLAIQNDWNLRQIKPKAHTATP